MTNGTVKFFNESKGYGFISPDEGGNDAFVHITALEAAGLRTLRENQRVGYELQEDRRGKMSAVNVRELAGDSAISGDDASTEASSPDES